MKPTVVRLPEEISARIDALVGEKRRAKFIREAIEEKLARSDAEQDAGEKS
jgi:predicted DNA-binding protein